MNIAFNTLGCKVNHYETEALQTLFKQEGFSVVDFKAFADIYVINTCTVTNTSDSKSRKAIRRAVRKNPDAIVAVIGCYAQVDSDTIAAIDGVDIIMGTTDRSRLLSYVRQFLRERKQILDVKDLSRYKKFDQLNVTAFEENTRAFLKIQDGCNEFCSYCIIPFARGRVRSRPMGAVLDEARLLVHKGYKEIVLTGIHTGGYGADFENVSFYDLLKAMSEIEGLIRIRISSVEINQLTDQVIGLIGADPTFARHLHIPLQHGDDSVLEAMRRRYDTKAYLDKIAAIRNRLGDIAITTDVIVGFPGETEAAFENMMATVEDAGFSEMHIFPYSKRSGTKAAESKEQIHGTVKSLRVNTLLGKNEQLARRYRDRLLEKKTPLSVLFESCDGTRCKGHTSEYVSVTVETGEDLVNQVRLVTLEDAGYPEASARLSD